MVHGKESVSREFYPVCRFRKSRVHSELMTLSPGEQHRNYRLGIWNGIVFQLTFPFVDVTLILPLYLSELTDNMFIIGLAGAIAMCGPALMQAPAAGMLPRISSRLKLYLNVGWIRIASLLSVLFLVFAVYPATNSKPVLLVGSLVCLAVLQLSTGFSSLAFLEIVRTSMPVSHRGRLWGYRKFIGGIGVILLTPLIGRILEMYPFPYNYGLLFTVVWILTCFGIAIFGFVREAPHTPDPFAPKFPEFISRTTVKMRQEPGYIRLFTAQILAKTWMMALPFYIIFAQNDLGVTPVLAMTLLAFQVAGKILSNLLWATLNDRYCSRMIYRWVPIPAVLAPGLFLLAAIQPDFAMSWLSAAFFFMGAAITGFQIGFTNVTLDLADRGANAGGIGVMHSADGILSLLPMAGGLLIACVGFQGLFILTVVTAVSIFPVSRILLKDSGKRPAV